MWETRMPGSGRSPGAGTGNPLQYSCQESPVARGTWRATVHGVAKSWTWQKRLSTRAGDVSLESTELGTARLTWQNWSAGSWKGGEPGLYCTCWALTLSLPLDPGGICPCHSPPCRHGCCTIPTAAGGPPSLCRDHMIGEPRSPCPRLGCRRSWESKYLSGSDSTVGGGLCLEGWSSLRLDRALRG